MTKPGHPSGATSLRRSGGPAVATASRRKVTAVADLVAVRLEIQGLTSPSFASPAETVGWFGGMQAQEYGYAKWSVAQRIPGADEAAIDEALAEGTILRTHVLRPTWHYVRREDIRWLQTATAHRVRRMMASYDRALELDEAFYRRSQEIISRTLEGNRHRTRAELTEALGAEGIEAKGQRLGHIVMRAELDALVCSGIPRGKQITYALVNERAPDALVLDADEALAQLTRRYFASHGPATEKDFRWWASLTAGEARRGMEMLDGELERCSVDDLVLWWIPMDTETTAEPGPDHLLQIYDESIVGYTESRKVLDPAGVATATGIAKALPHAVLLGGQLVGSWRRKIRGDKMVIEVRPVRRWTRPARRALRQAVERYAGFAGMPATIEG